MFKSQNKNTRFSNKIVSTALKILEEIRDLPPFLGVNVINELSLSRTSFHNEFPVRENKVVGSVGLQGFELLDEFSLKKGETHSVVVPVSHDSWVVGDNSELSFTISWGFTIKIGDQFLLEVKRFWFVDHCIL